MKQTALFLVIIFYVCALSAQNIPYNHNPDWESTPLGHIATGLGLADINGDGWKDIVAANGNDIQRQSLVVYYNNGDGTFPAEPSWSSSDIDYHGHCAVGDIDKDGWIDVAVSVYIGEAGFSEPGKVKVYYNTGGELESAPSFQSIEFYTFSCALGDADADGDLDLAVAASESYGDIWDYGKVFLNNDGEFNETPDWESSNLMGAMDVEFADMDKNGFLDLVFVGNNYPSSIFLADNSGVIDQDPDWQSSEALTYNNSLDIGFIWASAHPGFVTTGNNQLGGDGKVRLYDFHSSWPVNSYAAWSSPQGGYGSGIFLSDVNLDGNLDIIYGGWWEPVEIIMGTQYSFENNIAFATNTNSVVEAIQLADLGRENLVANTNFIPPLADQSHAIYLYTHHVIEKIISIHKNSILLSPEAYCYVPNKNWISFAEPASAPNDIYVIEFIHSPNPDMVITNWDSGKGNYIFYNTNVPIGMNEAELTNLDIDIFPNPAHEFLKIKSPYLIQSIRIVDRSGRVVTENFPQDVLADINIKDIEAGFYFAQIKIKNRVLTRKIVVY